jgi:hypothetical protein
MACTYRNLPFGSESRIVLLVLLVGRCTGVPLRKKMSENAACSDIPLVVEITLSTHEFAGSTTQWDGSEKIWNGLEMSEPS